MPISREEVFTIASLARLKVEPESVDALAVELSKILDYVTKLDELDTTNVEPTAQVATALAPLRKDELNAGVEKKDALSQAPRADEVGFLVPGFVD